MAGDRAAGSATGLLMLFGNAGGVVVTVVMVAVKGDEPTFARAVYVLYASPGVALVLDFALREAHQPVAAAQR